MSNQAFNDGWQVRRESDGTVMAVVLPHDAMLWEGRRADAPAGSHEAFFLGGTYWYSKTFLVPEAWRGMAISLLFEGVYQHSCVYVNGREVGGALNGYAEFEIRIDAELLFGADNSVEVRVDNAALPNSRWYSGSGIYRPVWLNVRDVIHVKPDKVQFRTLSIGDPARILIAADVANPHGEAIEISAHLARHGVEVARGVAKATMSAEIRVEVPSPLLWTAEEPNLYDCTVQVAVGGRLRDEHSFKVGLRTIEMDGSRGLRINGRPVVLRGGNVHHDSGVLGAATFRDAELRRIRILKENGFNAVRSAHNPASRALIEACDVLGMYVMDELFDGWYDHKTDHDDAPRFEAIWRETADATIARDRLHPSVIMYSIGNENSEPVSAYGIETARRLAARVRALDPDRAITAGVNLMSAALGWPRTRKGSTSEQPASKIAPNMNSTMVNAVTNQFARLMKTVPRLKRTDAVTRDMFDLLDVAGYNYGTVRYARDSVLHPERVIVGTETVPGDIAETWSLVERVPNVIGDFMWAGWDYLGEAGVGTWAYGPGRNRLLKPYPQLIAGCGAIDVIGVPDASVLLAQAAWGLLAQPAITVRPLNVAGEKIRRTAWRGTDAVASWSWRGCAGKLAEIEVVCRDEAVELRVNGRTLGRRPAGAAAGHVARFRTAYVPGEITAIAYRGGVETGRSTLRSAGAIRVRLVAENTNLVANGQNLAFLRIELADEAGTIEMLDDDEVRIHIKGPATLAGFGSAVPATEESFTDNVHRTYRGRGLAVIRSGTMPGVVQVTAVSLRHGDASIALIQTAE